MFSEFESPEVNDQYIHSLSVVHSNGENIFSVYLQRLKVASVWIIPIASDTAIWTVPLNGYI